MFWRISRVGRWGDYPSSSICPTRYPATKLLRRASTDESGKTVLDLGSLYRIIGRLIKKGLLEDVTTDQADSKRQRRYYRATDLGRRVARAEAARLRELLASERGELLWQEP